MLYLPCCSFRSDMNMFPLCCRTCNRTICHIEHWPMVHIHNTLRLLVASFSIIAGKDLFWRVSDLFIYWFERCFYTLNICAYVIFDKSLRSLAANQDITTVLVTEKDTYMKGSFSWMMGAMHFPIWKVLMEGAQVSLRRIAQWPSEDGRMDRSCLHFRHECG